MHTTNQQIQRSIIKANRECMSMIRSFHTQLKRNYRQTLAQDRQLKLMPAKIGNNGLATLTSTTRQTTSRDCANALLLVLFGLLHMADGIITYLGLKFSSVDEANPVLVFFADQFGLGYSITAMKLMCIAVIAYLFFGRRKIKSRLSTATLTGAVTFYCWVVSNNVFLVVNA